jgi:hypothetical protein
MVAPTEVTPVPRFRRIRNERHGRVPQPHVGVPISDVGSRGPSRSGTAAQGPHPLALSLAERLPAHARVLVLGAGSGRSLPALEQAGLVIETAPADEETFTSFPGPYDGVLSTHALLHGTCASVTGRMQQLRGRLAPGGRLHATFGSTSDHRCGAGAWQEGEGWTPIDGDEAGIVHAYFDRTGIEGMFEAFSEVHIEERAVRDIVGRWAHRGEDASLPSVHWFVEARRP